MFLSTENPPHDPLSSSSPATSSLLHLTTSSHELGQSHLQNFSIRDYAYSNRKNSIKNSWPFSPKSLQICSTHGVTDPLPPFETTASSSSGKQIVSHVHRGTGLAKLGLKGGCSQSRVIKNGFGTSTSVLKSKVEILVAGTSNNNKNSKKCGRVGGMVKSKEDTCGGGLVMTTTCPICKTFSSASNTTLNAHIDQCLIDQPKPQMKVKTMVDIYASAKRCTLEDLDKRNGTTWVSILSHTNRVVADKVSKKRKASPVGVGPVYIDAKGQKLRILTEFSEKKTCTTTTLREQHEGGSSEKKSSSQGSKENSKSLRKRRLGKKHYKYLKLTNLKANNTSEVPDYQRVFCGEGSSKGHRRIYNQRMLSKPGLVSKRLNEKGHKLYDLRDQPSEDDDDSWSGGERLVLRGTDSSPLKKQKEVSGRNKAMFGSKGAQSRSFRVQMSEKEEASLAVAHLDTLQVKKRLASIQENKYPLGKNVSEVSPRATSMRKVSPQFVANGWRRLSLPVELKKARLDSSEEEEAGKWESEMTQERELSDDDYKVVMRRMKIIATTTTVEPMCWTKAMMLHLAREQCIITLKKLRK
ncbi:BnaA03g11010D [Brassica napus]|uniref:BnaA03g11010D protein n=1 Tax=Brassica napus TaxID=3708 RepID=A0A078HEJ9_BRANA|nr:BnaA03g11010D [Brassica napus]